MIDIPYIRPVQFFSGHVNADNTGSFEVPDGTVAVMLNYTAFAGVDATGEFFDMGVYLESTGSQAFISSAQESPPDQLQYVWNGWAVIIGPDTIVFYATGTTSAAVLASGIYFGTS